MRCFVHQDREAVGVCKSCDRGVCAECAVDLEQGLACRERCEDRTRDLIRYVDRNMRLYSADGRLLDSYRFYASFWGYAHIAIGLAFACWPFAGPSSVFFPVLLAAMFLAYGIVQVSGARAEHARMKCASAEQSPPDGGAALTAPGPSVHGH